MASRWAPAAAIRCPDPLRIPGMEFDLADDKKGTRRLVWDDLDVAQFVAAVIEGSVDASGAALPREHRPARSGGVRGSWATTHAA